MCTSLLAIEVTEKCVIFQLRGRDIVLSEAVKEVMFVIQLLERMKILVTYPVMVGVYNIGAIFMAKNITANSCNNHL